MADIIEPIVHSAQRLLDARPPRIVVALDGRIGASRSRPEAVHKRASSGLVREVISRHTEQSAQSVNR